jgi:transcriptional regulator with XRE-family HTH domain
MGRQERQLEPGPLRDFAYDLRMLRSRSGLTYRELARRAGYSASALSAAASGQALPSLDVLLAYAGACGADAEDWQRRWEELSAAGHDEAQDADALLVSAPSDGQPAGQAPEDVAAKTVPPERENRRHWLVRPVRFGLAPLILATAAIVTYGVLRAASPDTRVIAQPPATALAPSGPATFPATVPPASGTPTAGTPRAARPSGSRPSGSRPSGQQPPVISQMSPAASQATAGAGQPPRAARQQAAVTGQPASSAVPQARFDFEQTDGQWFVFWGGGVSTGDITSQEAYQGTHSYLVTLNGSSAARTAAVGVTEDGNRLQGLSAGTMVTVHLRSSSPGDTRVRFFAYDPSSHTVWAPQDAGGAIPLSTPGGAGWSTMMWTVPAVSHVHAIGIQLYSATGNPQTVAIDDVSW